MKKLYFAALLSLLCFFCRAQVSVTATAGTTGPTNYTTFRAALFAINSGTHQGVISISISGNTTEAIQPIFIASGTGSASYTSITVQPAAGVAATITGDITGALLEFSGADDITIDGLNSGGSSLTFINTNISATASCVRFVDGASRNLIQRCTLLSASPSNTSGTIVFGTSASGGNSTNHIVGNRIADASTGTPANGIYSVGTVGQENMFNFISGNLIYNYFQPAVATTGISLGAGNSHWTLENNEFYQTTPRVFTAGAIHRAIMISGGELYTVAGNIIGGSAPNAAGLYDISGSATRFTAIEIANAGLTLTSSIQGNIVRNMQVTTTSNAGAPQGIFTGIYVTGGSAAIGTVQGNIIGSATGNGSIRLIPSAGSSVVTGITYNSSGTADIRNNIVGSIDLAPTGVLSGNIFAVQVLGIGATVSVQNNTLGGSSANSISVGVKPTTTGNGLIRGILTNNNGTMTVRNNLVQNLTHNSSSATALFRAIECQVGTVNITGNTINNIAAEGSSVSTATHEGIGIIVSTSSPNIVIDSNTISNLMLTNTGAIGTILSGIYIGSLNTGARITRNRLFGFSNAATGVSATAPPVASGIYLRDVGATGELFVANNMIALGSAQTTNTSFIGIWNQVNPTVGYNERIYYNSINISGTAAAGAQPSFAFYRGNFSATFTGPTVDIKNNIFINSRNGGTGAHYAIANSYPASATASGWAANASDYNVLNANPATIGFWTVNQDFGEWKLISQGDNNSLSGVVVNFVDPATDLHLQAGNNAAVEAKATALVAVTTDYDNQPRDPLLPDLGADELLSVVPTGIEYFRGTKQTNTNLLEWKISVAGNITSFVVERSSDGRNFFAIGNIAGSITSETFSFYDLNPVPGTNFYRLKMQDMGGRISYSAILSLGSDVKDIIISTRPNISHDGMVQLYIQSEKSTAFTVFVTDASGRVLLKRMMNVAAGSSSYPLQLSGLAKGVYYLAFNDHGKLSTQKLIIE